MLGQFQVFADGFGVVTREEGFAGVFTGVTLEEAQGEVDDGYEDSAAPVAPGEGSGVEVRADPWVVDDVQDAEETDTEGDEELLVAPDVLAPEGLVFVGADQHQVDELAEDDGDVSEDGRLKVEAAVGSDIDDADVAALEEEQEVGVG